MGTILLIIAAVLAVLSALFAIIARRPATYVLRRQGETISVRSIEDMIDAMTPEEFHNLAFSVMVRHGRDKRRDGDVRRWGNWYRVLP